jgi:ParB family chromosome partitioning protein
MRHDEHYVEALTSAAGSPIGRHVPIDCVDPNPEQPRQVMGDLSELMASIAEKGIIEPIVVRQRGSRYQIVAGERRYQAAVQLGLREVPVVVRNADDHEMLEIALVENLQRRDLSAFEEAEALVGLMQRCGYTHEQLAQKLGKSRTSITESVSLTQMPDDVKNLCRLADIHAKSLLLQVVRQSDHEKMLSMVERISTGVGATRQQLRDETGKAARRGRPKHFAFNYRPPTKAFTLQLRFRKSDVPKDELIRTLESILDDLRRPDSASRHNAKASAAGD